MRSKVILSSRSPVCMSSSSAIAPKRKKVLVIAGTTSVGKTDLSLELASLLNGEVVSADSVQVFRKLDVGSAKVGREVTSEVRHHLLDVSDIDSEVKFSVADYCSLAKKAIEDIISRGCTPMVVGGTGLYICTLLRGGGSGSPTSTEEGKAMVDRIIDVEDGRDWDKSLLRLKALDPVYASTLSTNDWYRLRRGLEICLLSGRTVTSFKRDLGHDDSPYDSKCLFLSMPRVELFKRIDARCEAIIEGGLIQEVISLVKDGRLKMETQAGRSVGYRQVLEYLHNIWGYPCGGDDGDIPYSLKVPREKLRQTFYDFLFVYKSKTRQLSQSQLVWFKKEPDFQWLNMSPGGNRLSLEAVSKAVASWFSEGRPLPSEWDGKDLQTLTPEENQLLKEYSYKQCTPQIYADEEKVDSLLAEIEIRLQS